MKAKKDLKKAQVVDEPYIPCYVWGV